MANIYIFGIIFDNSTDFLIENIINLNYIYLKCKNIEIENINNFSIINNTNITNLIHNGLLNDSKELMIKHFIEYPLTAQEKS